MSDELTLRMQAGAGDRRAQAELGRMLLLAGNAAEGGRLIVAACAQNFAPALKLHAALAAIGYGRPRDLEEARALMARAASAGDAHAKGQLLALDAAETPDLSAWLEPPRAEQVFDAPRVYTVENFLPKSACSWLKRRTKKSLTPALIRDPVNGGLVPDPVRTCSGAGFGQLEPDLVLQLTCLRMAAALGVPVTHHETTNVMRYTPGQEYKAHYDFISPREERAFAAELQQIGQRVATLLIYLSDDYEGGETEFPRLNWRFKGKTGDALIFWNLSAQGALEPNSLHAGLPVERGEKWLLSKWVRAKPVPFV